MKNIQAQTYTIECFFNFAGNIFGDFSGYL